MVTKEDNTAGFCLQKHIVSYKLINIFSKRSVLEEELKTWRIKQVDEQSSLVSLEDCSHGYESDLSTEPPYDDYAPLSPSQPADPNTSVVDSLVSQNLIKH